MFLMRIRKRFFTERSEEHTSELQSLRHLVCRLLLEKKRTRSSSRMSSREILFSVGSWRGRAHCCWRIHCEVLVPSGEPRAKEAFNATLFFLKNRAPPNFYPFPHNAALPI